MKCANATAFGAADEVLCIATDWPAPVRKKEKSQLIVRVQACSISPGDTHMLSGRLKFVLRPPAFPYIVGMDVCGIVEEGASGFRKGDYVMATNGTLPIGGMADLMVVDVASAAPKPDNVTVLEAASCTSAITAMQAVELARVKAGSRVLVLGGSGGVGSAAVQLARNAGATFIASTSTQVTLLKSLGVDEIINYTESNWWEKKEFETTKFDAIIDCVGGKDHWGKARPVLKSGWNGGRFVAVVGDMDISTLQVHTAFQLMGLISVMAGRPAWTFMCPWVPKYVSFVSDANSAAISKVLALVGEKKLKIEFDPMSPFPFTSEGVIAAFQLQGGGHAHGKVVVDISGNNTT